ncbi:MAG: DNA polymerase I [Planctomycetota bacterium]|nr:DNA polymerase I [Planctomycetaceae bacterium]MDQ3329991.1 DNA polymerase I [Planctomycetota bacterium]
MSKLLYLIDTYSLVFQVFHGIPAMTSPKGEPTNAIFGFVRDLQNILRNQSPTHMILALEGDGPGERATAYADYKANRSEMPADLRSQIPRLLEIVDAMGIPTFAHDGYEADDVIATLARQAVEDGFDVRIVTSDKDARQLIGPQVKLFNCRKNQFLDEKFLLEDWGIQPHQVVDFQGLVGDSTDNIPGVPKVGPAAARALLDQFGSLDKVLASVAEIAPSRAINKTIRANLETYAEQARLSRQLATLRNDLPLDFDWDRAAVSEPDAVRLTTLYTDCGFRRYVEELKTTAAPLAASDGTTSQATIERQWRTIDTPEKFAAFAEELKRQKAFCVDLETTDLDPNRASIVGWAICWEADNAAYLPVAGPADANVLDPAVVLATLKSVLEDPNVEIGNQNIKYDMIVLRRAGIEIANVGMDPMVGDYLLDAGARSHGLDTLSKRYLNHDMIPITELIGKGKEQKRMFEVEVERVAEYAAEDADVAWRLCEIIADRLRKEHLWDLYWNLERPLIAVLAEMEFNGVRIDVEELGRQSIELTARLEQLEGEIHMLAGRPFNIGSPKQLQQVLFDELKLPVVKRTKTGPSTDVEVLEKLAHRHELPAKIIEHRTLAKLKGTYVDAFPKLVNPATGNVHCSFNQTVAATGRLSSSDPNLQNIPIRTEEGRRVRKAFVPSQPGWMLLSADYSQIELRMLAHFSGDEVLIEAFREGRDIHATVAADIFSVPLDAVTADMRRIAKTVNFGVIYGQSPYGLSAVLGIPQEQAAAFIDEYLARYKGVAKLIRETLSQVRNLGYATTILGRRREITGIRPFPTPQMTLPERTAFNAVIQGSAADLIKRAMINIHAKLRETGHPGRMLLQIHDELVFETPADRAEDLASLVRDEMQSALELSVPLEVDTGIGANWLDAK